MAPPTVKAGHSKHKPHPGAASQALKAPSNPAPPEKSNTRGHYASPLRGSYPQSKTSSGHSRKQGQEPKSSSKPDNNTGRKSNTRRTQRTPHKDAVLAKQRALTLANSAESEIQANDVRNIFWNPTSSSREIVFKFVDFFDSPPVTGMQSDPYEAYQQYKMDIGDILNLANAGGASTPAARVTKFRLYALPQFSVVTASSTVAVLFGLPVGAGQDGSTMTAATKTTILTPTSVSDWVIVGEWDEATITSTANQFLSDGNTLYTILGSWVVVDADTFLVPELVSDANLGPVQYMAEITVAQALPNLFAVEAGQVQSTTNSFGASIPGFPVSNKLMAEAISTRKTE